MSNRQIVSASLLRADARAMPLADDSVDLIVTSPPYFALRSYQDDGEHYEGQIGSEPSPREFLEALWAVTAECKRVLKPSGSMFINLGDKYAGSGGHNNDGISAKSTLRGNGHEGGGPKIKATRRSAPDRYNQNSGGIRRKSLLGLPWRYANGAVDQLDLILRAEIIWSKSNGLPESVTDRVRRSHEQWFHFTKSETYFESLDEIREPLAEWTLKAYEYEQKAGGYNRKVNEDRVDGGDALAYSVANPKGKVPGSVWKVNLEPLIVPDWLDVDHFAAFPQEFPRRFILGWCPPGGIVLDPFVGTGTVPMVARVLDRHGIGFDLSSDYLRLANWRVFKSGHGLKSVARTMGERQGTLV